MSRIATLRELVEQIGDDELTLPKPLSEAAFAEVTEAMRLLSAAGQRIDASLGAMQHCQVPVDVRPFRRVQDCLTEAWSGLCRIPLAHAEAVAREKGGGHV